MQTESQSQAERYASCPYNVVEKQTAKYENMERKVTEVMGGTVLNYGSKELYLEAYKAGWEKGWKAGWKVGWEKGLKEWRIDLVTRKYQRGESVEKIADDLLMTTSEVEKLLNHQKEADDDSFQMGSLEIAALLGHWKWF